MVGVRPGTRDGLRKHVVRSHLLAPLGLVISPIARLGEVHGRSGCRDGPGGGRPAFIHSANEAGTREGAHVGSTWADMGCVQGAHICSALGSKGHIAGRGAHLDMLGMSRKPSARSSAHMRNESAHLHEVGGSLCDATFYTHFRSGGGHSCHRSPLFVKLPLRTRCVGVTWKKSSLSNSQPTTPTWGARGERARRA